MKIWLDDERTTKGDKSYLPPDIPKMKFTIERELKNCEFESTAMQQCRFQNGSLLKNPL